MSHSLVECTDSTLAFMDGCAGTSMTAVRELFIT